MRGESVLYETIYESILTQLYSGVLRCGQALPSQQELCRRYHVGITTIRRVVRMLERDGVIDTASGRRAVVRLDVHDELCVNALLSRKESILDIYGGLELLMPALYAQGARRCVDLPALYIHLEAVRGGAEQIEVYDQAVRFFTELLVTYRNPVILDLQSGMEHYSRIPHIVCSGLEDPYAITADFVKSKLRDMYELIAQGRTDALICRLEQMYRNIKSRAKCYLKGLEERWPPASVHIPYQWYSGKGRTHLYTVVARKLYRRIEAGEFVGRTYLPSVPEIMRTYSVSKDTACSAAALLSDIGLVRTLDKRGMVLREGDGLPPLRLGESVIGEHLVLCVDAMQILAVCAGRLAFAAATCLPHDAARSAAQAWEPIPRPGSARIVQLLLDFLQRFTPCRCLRTILEQFDDLLIWGHYLNRLDWDADKAAAQEAECRGYFEQLRGALARGDAERFSAGVQDVFRAAYDMALTQASRCVPAGRLPTAL